MFKIASNCGIMEIGGIEHMTNIHDFMAVDGRGSAKFLDTVKVEWER